MSLWTIVSSLLQAAAVVDVGLAPAIQRQLAQGRDQRGIEQLGAAALRISFIAAALTVMVSAPLLLSLEITLATGESAVMLAVTMAVALISIQGQSICLSVLLGRGRGSVAHFVLMIAVVFRLVAVVLMAAGGAPIVGVALAFVVGGFISVLLSLSLDRYLRYSASRVLRLAFAGRVGVRGAMREGVGLLMVRLTVVVRDPVFRTTAVTMWSLSAFAPTAAALRVYRSAHELPSSGSNVLLTQFADAGHDTRYNRRIRRVFVTTGAVLGGTIILFSGFIDSVWLSGKLEGADLQLRIIGVGLVFALGTVPDWYLLQARNLERHLVAIQLVAFGTTIAVVVSAALAGVGVWSLPVAWLAGDVIVFGASRVAVRRYCGATEMNCA